MCVWSERVGVCRVRGWGLYVREGGSAGTGQSTHYLSCSLTLNHRLDGVGGLGYFNINIKYLSIRTLQLNHRHGDIQPVCV